MLHGPETLPHLLAATSITVTTGVHREQLLSMSSGSIRCCV